MSIEKIIDVLLNVSEVVALVGDRRRVAQLKQRDQMPAIVFKTVSSVPIITMNAVNSPQLLISRVQIIVMDKTPEGVNDVHHVVMQVLNLKSGTYAGKTVVSVLRDIKTELALDNEIGLWYGSQDFIVHWYE